MGSESEEDELRVAKGPDAPVSSAGGDTQADVTPLLQPPSDGLGIGFSVGSSQSNSQSSRGDGGSGSAAGSGSGTGSGAGSGASSGAGSGAGSGSTPPDRSGASDSYSTDGASIDTNGTPSSLSSSSAEAVIDRPLDEEEEEEESGYGE